MHLRSANDSGEQVGCFTSSACGLKRRENRLLLLAALLSLLDGMLCLLPSGGAPYPAGVAGVALYYIACLSGPRLWKKAPFTSRELALILACGVLACVLLIPFVDTVWAALPQG